jgi:quercetin dioxygenase-like cupin family protein
VSDVARFRQITRNAGLILISFLMHAFPEFMKHPANRIARSNQATRGVEGYVFDGEDGSQMAFWTCPENAVSDEHVHEYDEYMLVVQGCYTLLIEGKRIPIRAGEEYFIARGVRHGGEVVAGTRTIHAFGGHRADRERHSATQGDATVAAKGRSNPRRHR